MAPVKKIESASPRVELSPQVDYYEANSRRVLIDFCLGFFGSIIATLVIYCFYFFPIFLTNEAASNMSSIILLFILRALLTPVIFILFIWIAIASFKRGRKFIGIGMMSSLILPFILMILAFGACLIFFSSTGF